MGLVHLIVQTMYFLLPAYTANMAPAFIRRIPASWLKKPVDTGAKLSGKPVFGKNKTWGGLLGGIAIGWGVFLIQRNLAEIPWFKAVAFFDYGAASVWLGLLLAAGALLGDLTKSFFKRRAGVKPGAPWPPFDQLDYVIGAFVLSSIILIPPKEIIILGVVISGFLHVAVNRISFLLGLQNNKW